MGRASVMCAPVHGEAEVGGGEDLCLSPPPSLPVSMHLISPWGVLLWVLGGQQAEAWCLCFCGLRYPLEVPSSCVSLWFL